jgi:FKBP-type peptidyl-prolyl cis-trans isomerase
MVDIMSDEKTVQNGSKVKLDYTGKLDDGTVFDSSKHGDHSHPLEFTAGEGMVIKGFDDAVMGMKKGEKKDIQGNSRRRLWDAKSRIKTTIPKR